MYRELVFRYFIRCCLISAMSVAFTGIGFCQDLIVPYVMSSGFRVLPITRALTEMPMPISFNGISNTGLYSGIPDEHGENQIHKEGFRTGVRLSMQAAGINAGLARLRNSLFQYIQVSGPDVSGASDFPNVLDDGSAKVPGDICLEFQADIADMSGALFFVMKI